MPASSSQRPPRTRRRRSLRDLRVRTKLAAVLVIPALAFTAIAGVQIASAIGDRTALSAFAARMDFAGQVTGLVHALQTERDHTAGEMGAGVRDGAFDAAVGPERRSVDEEYTRLEQAIEAEDAQLRRSFTLVAAHFSELRETRDAARTGTLRMQVVFDSYRRLITDLFTLLPASTQVPDPRLSEPVQAFLDMARATEQASQLRGLVFAVSRQGSAEPATYPAITALVAEQRAAVSQFRLRAPDADVSLIEGPAYTTIRDQVLEQARLGRVIVPAGSWWQAASTELRALRELEVKALQAATGAANSRSAEQDRRTILLIALILLVLAITIATSTLVGRSMVRSLRELRAQALDVARRRLPDAIERLRATENADNLADFPTSAITVRRNGRDEIGEVAEAFASVHSSAVKLATEQAILRRGINRMIVSLARRSQGMVERQLRLLDDIEAAETDPDQLANLFRLDHLVTRMRRNDENLLVLTGADTSRRRPDPVPLGTVVLAAMAEIEQYERVHSKIDEGAYVVGGAVVDLVRLLAELLENATVFSPPDSRVAVLGRLAGDGHEALILIEDRGLGMTPKGLAEANARLRNPMAIGASAAERMGLLVVGRLAVRHGIRVELRALSTGVQAEITLPSTLLAAPPARPHAGFAGSLVRRSMAHLLATGNLPSGAVPAQRSPDRLITDRLEPDRVAADWAAGQAGPGLRPAAAAPADVAGRRGNPTRAEDVLDGATDNDWWSRPTGERQPAAPQTGMPAAPQTGVPAAPQTGVPAAPQSGVPVPPPGGVPAAPQSGAPAPPPAGVPVPSAGMPAPSAVPSQPAVAPQPAVPPQPAETPVSDAGLPVRVPMAQLPLQAAAGSASNAGNPAPPIDPDEVSQTLSRFYSGVHRATAEDLHSP